MPYTINTYVNSPDNALRFVLGYNNTNPLIVIGVNPSTANDRVPDATIRRVLGYVSRNNFNGFLMINVYPYRSTNPQNLPEQMDKTIHQQNLHHILEVFSQHPNATVLVAFGNPINKRKYLKECFADIVKNAQQFNLKWKQIGKLTAADNPRHPSRGAYQPLEDFIIKKLLRS